MSERPSITARLLAEFVGTFTLITVGLAAVLNTSGSDLLAVALAHGLAIAVMVSAIGHVSGGHLNPAVTTAMVALRRMPLVDGLFYIVAQLAGATVGALLIKATWQAGEYSSGVFKSAGEAAVKLGPSVSPGTGMLLEAVATFLLVWVVFATAVDRAGSFSQIAGLGIGLTVAIDILWIGPMTGATMNPARWFGPNLVTGSWADAWVWIVGPLLGAVVAGVAYMYGIRPGTEDES